MVDFESQRMRMVQTQLAQRGIRDERVLRAMRTVPRERFVRPRLAAFAYEDSPLPIEEDQTISQPFIVATMVEAAEIGPGDKVLEVGTGSGYAAAVIGLIAARVHTIERHERLVGLAEGRFNALGYRNIAIHLGDGTTGWPDAAPFDAILIAAAGPAVPQALKEQLSIGGRLVMPVGLDEVQQLVKIRRTGESEFDQESLGMVSFVLLIGEQGWAEDA